MSKDPKPAQKRIDQFLNGPGGRADDWRDLVEAPRHGPAAGTARTTMPRWPICR